MLPDPHSHHPCSCSSDSPEAEPLIQLDSPSSVVQSSLATKEQSSKQYISEGSDLPLKKIGPAAGNPPALCEKCHSARMEYILQYDCIERLWDLDNSFIFGAQRRIRYIHLITYQIQYWAEASLFRLVNEVEVSAQSLYAMDLMNTFSTALNIRYPCKLFENWDLVKYGGVRKPKVFWDYWVDIITCGSWSRSGRRWNEIRDGITETKRHLWVWHDPKKAWEVYELFSDFEKVKEEFAFLGISEVMMDPNEEDLAKLSVVNINKDISHGNRLKEEVYDRALKGMREWLERNGFSKPVWKEHNESV